MSYKLMPSQMYRMPTHFGPSLGPRQGENGRKFSCLSSPKTTVISTSFLTRREQLEGLLPDGFEVGAEPIVTVAFSYMTEIEWLAGRGYNTLGVSFPAVFNGTRDREAGNFLAVLWENLADPIITGREELGFAKVYCEIPEPRVVQEQTHCMASWLGFRFLDLRIWNMTQLIDQSVTSREAPSEARLHYKYIPKTGEWGSADAAYATLTPAQVPNRVVKERWRGEGSVQFHKATWEDLPTLVNIVNTLHDLTIIKFRGASIVKTVGFKDLGDQRILR